ncbi:hypothetical protein PYCC9005_005476 [Savitreella phatthalungensis]
MDYTVHYSLAASGRGVKVYVVDSGIACNHPAFRDIVGYRTAARRTGRLASCPDELNFAGGIHGSQDSHGHGSALAGTVAGRFGISRFSHLFSVRVLGPDIDGTGLLSNMLFGLEKILTIQRQSNDPSIVLLGISLPKSEALDVLLNAMERPEMTVVAAASDSSELASSMSPATAVSPLVVAASDIQDRYAVFSGHGRAVDCIAPGVHVPTVDLNSFVPQFASGTSLAAGYTAGTLACWFTILRRLRTMQHVRRFMLFMGSKSILSGVPENTVNLFVQMPLVTRRFRGDTSAFDNEGDGDGDGGDDDDSGDSDGDGSGGGDSEGTVSDREAHHR